MESPAIPGRFNHWGRLTSGSDLGTFADRDRARFKGALSMSLAGDALYYMRNRWYEPQSGRFLSADPIGLSGGLNAYTFAGNDPVNASDPEGLCATIRVNMKTGEWHAYGCGPRSDANHCWGIANSNIHPQCTAGTTDEVGGSGDYGAFGSWGGGSVPGGIPSHSPGPHALTAGYGNPHDLLGSGAYGAGIEAGDALGPRIFAFILSDQNLRGCPATATLDYNEAIYGINRARYTLELKMVRGEPFISYQASYSGTMTIYLASHLRPDYTVPVGGSIICRIGTGLFVGLTP
jgi:RHS repeat-associated protein